MIEQTIRIQFVSDLHLEMWTTISSFQPEQCIEPGQADILALAGDIGYPEEPITAQFLDWCSKNWRTVLWIPGNHEFYSTFHSPVKYTITEKLDIMRRLCSQFPNVYMLNHNTFDIPHTHYRIIGCTLWSDIPDEKDVLVARYMNDCRLIFVEQNVKANPFDLKQWFQRDVSWIQNEIRNAQNQGKELIVLSHHLPTQQLVHPKYEDHPLNCCYASSLDSMIHLPIRAWICGHSHMSNDANVNSVLCALNPFGYPGEYERTFSRKKVIEIGEDRTILYDGEDITCLCSLKFSST